mgnify:CR=1 FL=1
MLNLFTFIIALLFGNSNDAQDSSIDKTDVVIHQNEIDSFYHS